MLCTITLPLLSFSSNFKFREWNLNSEKDWHPDSISRKFKASSESYSDAKSTNKEQEMHLKWKCSDYVSRNAHWLVQSRGCNCYIENAFASINRKLAYERPTIYEVTLKLGPLLNFCPIMLRPHNMNFWVGEALGPFTLQYSSETVRNSLHQEVWLTVLPVSKQGLTWKVRGSSARACCSTTCSYK